MEMIKKKNLVHPVDRIHASPLQHHPNSARRRHARRKCIPLSANHTKPYPKVTRLSDRVAQQTAKCCVDGAMQQWVPTFLRRGRETDCVALAGCFGLSTMCSLVAKWKIVGGTRRLAHCPAGGLYPGGDPVCCNHAHIHTDSKKKKDDIKASSALLDHAVISVN